MKGMVQEPQDPLATRWSAKVRTCPALIMVLSFLLIISPFLATNVVGQTTTATIQGTITDAQ
ncbi:MAG TPA: hypothetical protein VJ180_11165, partial [Pyrinomonadaceae bacterium]|nr:hypothetical protein [Pyrinomonadaceae bacterium]